MIKGNEISFNNFYLKNLEGSINFGDLRGTENGVGPERIAVRKVSDGISSLYVWSVGSSTFKGCYSKRWASTYRAKISAVALGGRTSR
jgi:hypothetical protein